MRAERRMRSCVPAGCASSSVAARCRFDSVHRWRLDQHIVDVRDIMGVRVVQSEWAAPVVHRVALRRRIELRTRALDQFLDSGSTCSLRSSSRSAFFHLGERMRRLGIDLKAVAFHRLQHAHTRRIRRRRARGALERVRRGLFVRSLRGRLASSLSLPKSAQGCTRLFIAMLPCAAQGGLDGLQAISRAVCGASLPGVTNV